MRIPNVILVVLLSGCGVAPTPVPADQEEERKYTTRFPSDPLMQAPDEPMASVAYPLEEGRSRIWVKGSETLPAAEIRDGERVLARIALAKPHYTGVVDFAATTSAVTAVFRGSGGTKVKGPLRPATVAGLRKVDSDPYSVVFYGCFQPFAVGEDMRSAVFRGNAPNSNFAPRVLRFFRDAVLDGAGGIPQTRLVVGTGDQVYVDAGYETKAENRSHPLSAWTEEGENLRSLPGEFEHHLDDMYRAFFSFKDMREIFASVPQVNAWDDHEIRDGWGSVEGDYSDSTTINPHLQGYFDQARTAYIEHQYVLGAAAPPTKGADLQQEFVVGKLAGFVLDLRSKRNLPAKRVISASQMEAFGKWLAQNKGRHVLIVSSMPLFLVNRQVVELASNLKKTYYDDAADGWASESNIAQRDQIIQKVLDAQVMPIFISGDYHKAALSEIWLNRSGAKTVFGYELLATGLYHEGLVQGSIARGAFGWIEGQRSGEHFVDLATTDGEAITLEPYVMSGVANNFGAVTVSGNEVSIKLVVADEGDGTNSATVYSRLGRWGQPFNEKTDLTTHWATRIYNAVLWWRKPDINIPAPPNTTHPLPELETGEPATR